MLKHKTSIRCSKCNKGDLSYEYWGNGEWRITCDHCGSVLTDKLNSLPKEIADYIVRNRSDKKKGTKKK